jgi:hypothetical protein
MSSSSSATSPTPRMPASAQDGAGDFEFTSTVDRSWCNEVESLFFFNPQQSAWIESIRDNVAAFGAPQIVARGERISLGIPERDAQCLFACDRSGQPSAPVGVVLYLRTAPHLLRILHLAVGPDYAERGPLAAYGLALRLVDEVRALGRRIAGVSRVQLPYRSRGLLPVIDRGSARRVR